MNRSAGPIAERAGRRRLQHHRSLAQVARTSPAQDLRTGGVNADLDQTDPKVERVTADSGRIRLTLTERPMSLERGE